MRGALWARYQPCSPGVYAGPFADRPIGCALNGAIRRALANRSHAELRSHFRAAFRRRFSACPALFGRISRATLSFIALRTIIEGFAQDVNRFFIYMTIYA